MLLDIDDTLIAYLGAALAQQWPDLTVPVKTASVTEAPTGSAPAVHLMLDSVIEHPQLKGVGENVSRGDNNNTLQKPAPSWLICRYQMAPIVPQGALGMSPFEGDNLRQMQLKLLEPMVNKLLSAQPLTTDDLRGRFAAEADDNEMSHMTFECFKEDAERQIPIVEFSLTVAVQLRELQVIGPVLETQLSTDIVA